MFGFFSWGPRPRSFWLGTSAKTAGRSCSPAARIPPEKRMVCQDAGVKLQTATRGSFERGESKTPRHVSGHCHGFMGCPSVPGMAVAVGLPRRPMPVVLLMALLFPAIASASTTPFCMAPRVKEWWRQPKPSSRARSSFFSFLRCIYSAFGRSRHALVVSQGN